MRNTSPLRQTLLFAVAIPLAGCLAIAPFADAPRKGRVANAAVEGNVRAEPTGDVRVLTSGDAEIELRIPSEPMDLSAEEISRWVRDCARAVAQYYGHFPVRRAIIELTRTESRRVDGGRTVGFGDAVLIRVELGARADASDLARDWVMTHEMVHTALPDLPARHLWLEEGLATYVEPIARAQAGLESAEDVWKQLVEGLPRGLPERGDRGLDRTPTWGRIYWGGALFCLLADVEIRERTNNRAGLQDALRAIAVDGRSTLRQSPIDRVLAQGDDAVGVPVLSELYARHAAQAESVDLADLWKRLGISIRRGRISFDDSAPLAHIRREITRAER
jgi:hypothetical protein